MVTNSTIAKFFLKCLAFYIAFILLGSIPGVDVTIGEVFRNMNNARFHGLFENTTVEFQKIKNSPFDTSIYIRCANERQWNFAEFKLDSWYMFFIPNAIITSLLLATSFATAKKRHWMFAIGFVLTNVLLYWVLFIRVSILRIQVQSSLGNFENTFSDKLVIFFHNNLAVYGWIGFVLPVFSWIAVSFSKAMLNRTNFQIMKI